MHHIGSANARGSRPGSICPASGYRATLLLAALLAIRTQGQSLLTNGGFETYSSLPTATGQLCRAAGWLNPGTFCYTSPLRGSPDYIHVNGVPPVQAPTSVFGTMIPHTGLGYAGFTTIGGASTFREYVAKAFDIPMVVGQSYNVSFYLTRELNAYGRGASNNIGVHFSTAALFQGNTAPINVLPQWEYTSVFADTSWTLFTFNFTATAAFTHMTIGNFRSNLLTTLIQIPPVGISNSAYYLIDDVSVIVDVVLPIELIAFDAVCKSDEVLLRWSTATETNNDHFTIERSGDGVQWEAIGAVPGAGNSQQAMQYSFTDPEVQTDTRYYRLMQVDYDGAHNYSPTVAVNGCGNIKVVREWLVDAQGRVCGNWPVAMGLLAPGVYLVRSEYSDQSVVISKFEVPQW